MSSDLDLAKILAALQETDKEDIVQEERARRKAARQSRVDADLEPMETDEGGVSILKPVETDEGGVSILKPVETDEGGVS